MTLDLTTLEASLKRDEEVAARCEKAAGRFGPSAEKFEVGDALLSARTALLARVKDCRELATALAAKQIALDEAFAVIERQRASLAEAVRALEEYGAHKLACLRSGHFHAPNGECLCGLSSALSSLQPRKDTP